MYVPGQIYARYLIMGLSRLLRSDVSTGVYTRVFEERKKAQVEVNFYSTAKPEEVWTGTTETVEVRSVKTAIKDLVKTVTAELENQPSLSQNPDRNRTLVWEVVIEFRQPSFVDHTRQVP